MKGAASFPRPFPPPAFLFLYFILRGVFMENHDSIWSRYFIQIMLANALAQLSVQMLNTTVEREQT